MASDKNEPDTQHDDSPPEMSATAIAQAMNYEARLGRLLGNARQR